MSKLIHRNFWDGKKVFLTGHTGFKGGWLSLWLSLMGAKVTGYSLPPQTCPNMFEKLNLSRFLHKSILGDVCNLQELTNAATAAEPDVIFHMAAQPLVRRSYFEPINTFATNVMGTVNILEIGRILKSVRAIVNVTTDKCYENNEKNRPFGEMDRLGGNDPYSASKACAEIVTSAYQKSYFHSMKVNNEASVASARAGNVFGGGDWAEDRIIPDAVRAFSENQHLLVRQPNSIRPWQFVLDPLFGYLLLAQKLYEQGIDFQGAWNFGPNPESEVSVSHLLNLFISEWGGDVSWTADNHVNSSLYESKILRLDISKSCNSLGWSPLTTLDQGIKNTVEWYLLSQRGDAEDLLRNSESQIDRYLKQI